MKIQAKKILKLKLVCGIKLFIKYGNVQLQQLIRLLTS